MIQCAAMERGLACLLAVPLSAGSSLWLLVAVGGGGVCFSFLSRHFAKVPRLSAGVVRTAMVVRSPKFNITCTCILQSTNDRK